MSVPRAKCNSLRYNRCGMSIDGASTRPGGRSARVRAAVHRAVGELLVEHGGDALTIPAIAQRAGVHPTTIYRRWGTVANLLTAVAVGRLSGNVVIPDTGSLRGDLTRWLGDVITELSDPDALLMLCTVVSATRDASARSACMMDRREQLQAILDADCVRGHEPRGTERLLETLLAPLYFRALFVGAPLPGERVEAIIDHALGDGGPSPRRDRD